MLELTSSSTAWHWPRSRVCGSERHEQSRRTRQRPMLEQGENSQMHEPDPVGRSDTAHKPRVYRTPLGVCREHPMITANDWPGRLVPRRVAWGFAVRADHPKASIGGTRHGSSIPLGGTPRSSQRSVSGTCYEKRQNSINVHECSRRKS